MGLYCSLSAFTPPIGPGTPSHGVADLDKTWHALHFLLSGTAGEGSDPSQFLLSGTQIAETPDHCKFHPHAAVEAFSRVLDAIDDTELFGRLDRRRMQELDIYPGGWGEDEEFDREFCTCLLVSAAGAGERRQAQGCRATRRALAVQVRLFYR